MSYDSEKTIIEMMLEEAGMEEQVENEDKSPEIVEIDDNWFSEGGDFLWD